MSCLLNGAVTFKPGDSLITEQDLNGLAGGRPNDEDNYLSNFIIDAYLKILAKEESIEGVQTESIRWELFHK